MKRLKHDIAIIVAPSPIHGVGLFAGQNINKNQIVHLWDSGDWRFIKKQDVVCDSKLEEMCERFSVESKEGFHAPKRFSSMSIGWLVNHSDSPNLREHEEEYYAMRNISEGEELFINYRLLDSDFDNLPTISE